MSAPLVISVILNTNRRDDTLNCLASITQSSYPNQRVIVLDNTSSDGSVAAIRAEHPQVEIIGLTENLGYAGNNNIGIAAAMEVGADWIFVLNEDIVLDPACLQRMIAVASADPQIGMLGPMVYHASEPTVIQSAGGCLNRLWEAHHIGQNEADCGQFVGSHEVEWVSGCAILVRRELIAQVGSIDVRFFYYWEETEWCVRARRHGWKIVHVPEAKIWHKGVQRNYQPKPSVSYYNTRNRLLLMAKHGAPLVSRAYAWSQMIRTLVSFTLRPKWRTQRGHRDAIWHGMRDYLRGRWGKGAY
jgi:GT2 family glycosyltransferase